MGSSWINLDAEARNGRDVDAARNLSIPVRMGVDVRVDHPGQKSRIRRMEGVAAGLDSCPLNDGRDGIDCMDALLHTRHLILRAYPTLKSHL